MRHRRVKGSGSFYQRSRQIHPYPFPSWRSCCFFYLREGKFPCATEAQSSQHLQKVKQGKWCSSDSRRKQGRIVLVCSAFLAQDAAVEVSACAATTTGVRTIKQQVLCFALRINPSANHVQRQTHNSGFLIQNPDLANIFPPNNCKSRGKPNWNPSCYKALPCRSQTKATLKWLSVRLFKQNTRLLPW